MNLKRIKFENLQVGKEYYVKCGIWQGCCIYVGYQIRGNKNKCVFTFGTLDTWEESFNLVSCKSNFKFYEILKG